MNSASGKQQKTWDGIVEEEEEIRRRKQGLHWHHWLNDVLYAA
jgi:hypothetical protein